MCRELNELVRFLDERDLAASSWYGSIELPDDLVTYERANRGYGYTPLPEAADDARFPSTSLVSSSTFSCDGL